MFNRTRLYLCNWMSSKISPKNVALPSGKQRKESTRLILKFLSPRLSDTTCFAHWAHIHSSRTILFPNWTVIMWTPRPVVFEARHVHMGPECGYFPGMHIHLILSSKNTRALVNWKLKSKFDQNTCTHEEWHSQLHVPHTLDVEV